MSVPVEQLYDRSILSCFLTECFNNDTSGKKKPVFLQWFDLSQTCCQKKKKEKRRQVNVILTRAEM